ncbi:unnamed protein product [Sphagnum tenellum]
MARSRNRTTRVFQFPAISSLAVVFGLALVALAVLSIISGRFLDNVNSGHTPIRPFQQASSEAWSAINETASSLQALEDVPGQWDTTTEHIWDSENAELYYGCSEPSEKYLSELSVESNGYLFIVASGGLNQQRTGITDSVVVARLLNATLVVPQLDHLSYWKDPSNFSDIFDVDWFISSVAPDVKVIKELPPSSKKFISNQMSNLRVPRKVSPHYYLTRILPILKRKQSVRLTKFDYRLANKLDPDMQKLRCRTNYKALQFTKPIQDMGQELVDRMRAKSGKYIALHLRYESDMLAFSNCYYGGGDKERQELGAIRKRWKSLHYQNPDKERRNGKCPLTPEEVGLMLRALGYGKDSYLYVASGQVYNGEASLAPLKALFPNFFTKDTLVTRQELQPFAKFSSRMAAIDYVVCSESDVFVANNNGNMARILAGERRFNGHKRTIRPNAKKLGTLFAARHTMSWKDFATKVRHFQKGFMGNPMEVRAGRGEFHENPVACICEKPEAQEKLKSLNQQQVKKPSKSVETVKVEEEGVVELQDPVIPVEDRLIDEAEDDAEDEELPLVIDDEQSNANEGDTNEELLLESEDPDENTDEDDQIAIKDRVSELEFCFSD